MVSNVYSTLCDSVFAFFLLHYAAHKKKDALTSMLMSSLLREIKLLANCNVAIILLLSI